MFSYVLGFIAFAAFAKSQTLDFEAIANALPPPTASIPFIYATDTGPVATATTISFDAPASYLAVASAILADPGDPNLDKRNLATTSCLAQPSGILHRTQPDTENAFAADQYYANKALAASVPSGYTTTFVNLNASSNAYGYLGYTSLSEYDVQFCSSKCDAIDTCQAFNICKCRLAKSEAESDITDFERDPSQNPDSASCSNPSSVTRIKVGDHNM